MVLPLFKRAAKRVLARMGEDSFLRGDVPCKVRLERDVQFQGYEADRGVNHGDFTALKDTAVIENIHTPRIGDTLTHPDGEFVLDAKVDTNGSTTRFIVRPAD